MKVNFSELLNSQRVGPLWGRKTDPQNAVDTLHHIIAGETKGDAGQSKRRAKQRRRAQDDTDQREHDPKAPDQGAASAKSDQEEGFDQEEVDEILEEVADPENLEDAEELVELADAPQENPEELMEKLMFVLRTELGPRVSMLSGIIEPLRVRIARLTPGATPPPYHPMRHASAGTVFELLYRLEDTLRGLRRVAGK